MILLVVVVVIAAAAAIVVVVLELQCVDNDQERHPPTGNITVIPAGTSLTKRPRLRE